MPPPYDLESLRKLAIRLAAEGPAKSIPTPRRIRILVDGFYIVDTCEARYVWEHPYYPQYYVPKYAFTASESVKVTVAEELKNDAGEIIASRWELQTPSRKLGKIICFANELTSGPANELADYVKIDFYEPDSWFEEETPIFVHPKDPFKRVDLIHSNRPVRVHIDGKKVAEAVSSIHLYETGLPVRFYLPRPALDQSVLKLSETKTQCPYKGESSYYHVVIDGKEHKDIVWYYNAPTIECAAIAGLCCFYNEKVNIEIMEGTVWKAVAN